MNKLESDFMDVKIEIRKLINTTIPKENDTLDVFLQQINDLIKQAYKVRIKENGNK